MTIKIRDMEIPILVFGPFLWPNHFIVLNCVVLAQENKETNKQNNNQHQNWYFIDNGFYHYLELNNINLW